MSRAFTDWNVNQAVLFPATARDHVPEDHPVHYIGQLVAEALDIAEDERYGFQDARRLSSSIRPTPLRPSGPDSGSGC